MLQHLSTQYDTEIDFDTAVELSNFAVTFAENLLFVNRLVVLRLLVDRPFFHDEDNVFHYADVVQRVSFDGNNIGQLVGFERS